MADLHPKYSVLDQESKSLDAQRNKATFSEFQYSQVAKDCLLTLVKSRLALGSPDCLFVRLVVTMPKMAQYREKMVFDCPIIITSKVKPYSRTQKTRKEE